MNRTSDPPDIKLVVFDLGRVLLSIVDDFDHACRLVGIDPLPGMSGDLSIHVRRASDPRAAKLFDGFETGRISLDHYLAEAAEFTGTDTTTQLKLLDACVIEAFPGVGELLDDLDATGVATACLSNTNSRHWALITDPQHPAHLPVNRLGFAGASHLIGHAKPHAAAYGRVEAATGIAAPHVLFFDDIADNLAAAQQRGWHGVLVERSENPIQTIRAQLRRYRVL